MKIRIAGQIVPVHEISIILDSGHTVRLQQSGEGILIMSGNAHIIYDDELSNSQQVRLKVRSPNTADVEEPPRIELKA
jgi:hypothetical protein